MISDAKQLPENCDIVMKGGITSGIIYPKLVAALSASYSFKSIGGTSAGAIAAAATAAAQLARLTDPKSNAFDRLADLPGVLSAPLGSKGSRLLNLFVPTSDNRPFFKALIAAISSKSTFWRLFAAYLSLLRSFWFFGILGMVPGSILLLATLSAHDAWHRWPAIALSAAVLVAGMIALVVLRAAMKLGQTLPASHFGLSTGMPPADEVLPIGGLPEPTALTPWFHRYLNGLAGFPVARPLTFGDLWAGRQLAADEVAPDRSKAAIALEIMTTSVTQGRPYKLPFETGIFYYRRSEFAKLFPDEIVSWMADNSPLRQVGDPVIGGEALLRLPPPDKFPVLVAVRLSLSFPLLISAIPLYAIDWTRVRNHDAREKNADGRRNAGEIDKALETRRQSGQPDSDAEAQSLIQSRAAIIDAAEKYEAVLCLFSDGGVCSNFPLHMFDSPLPLWPTFGVNLKPFHPDHPHDRAWLPEAQGAGILSHIQAPEGKTGLGAVVEFVWSIVATMQNWRDNLLAATPGYRDRIVHISHRAEEGGLNLNMPEALVTVMAASGQQAAGLLHDKFAAAGSTGWDEHRVTRMRSLLALLEDKLNDIAKSYPGVDAPTYKALVTRADGAPPGNYPFRSKVRMQLAESVLDELKKIADGIAASGTSLTDGQPSPVPELRITPRF